MFVLAAAGVLAASSLGGAATTRVTDSPSSRGATIKISVSAGAPWSASVPVTKGEKLTITATGEINYCNGEARCRATPDGSLVGEAICGTPPMCGALIGRFDAGTPFLVGKSTKLVAAANGKLYLGVNDLSGYYGDNSGAFSVVIQTTTTPPPPPTTTTTEGVDWPTVHAYPVTAPWPLRPGTYAWLPYTVKDASGKAKVRGTLYEGGTPVLTGGSKYFLAADGRERGAWKARLAADLTGPLRYCLWAVNPKGRESVLAPKSSCAWLSLLVDIDRVSNGCGGEGWEDIAALENYFGNEHTYKDSNKNPLAKTYEVNFMAACDLHDAGYGGMTVYDKLNNRTIDFRTWTRKRVDEKFWRDMKRLCDSQIRRQQDPGETATVALAKCKGEGGPASIGSEWLYNKVRYWGSYFFDADLTRPGHQASGHRDNS
jgi:hypothetical protein